MSVLILAAALAGQGLTPQRPGATLAEAMGTAEVEPVLRLNGMSEKGIRALRAMKAVPFPPATVDCTVQRLARVTPIDIPALRAAMVARDARAAEQARRRTARLGDELARLSSTDAAILLTLVGTGDADAGPPAFPPSLPIPSGGAPGGVPPVGEGPPPVHDPCAEPG